VDLWKKMGVPLLRVSFTWKAKMAGSYFDWH